jgi:hypothetical protein
MIAYTLATNVTAVGNGPTVAIETKNTEVRNTNNTGLLHVYQTASGIAGATLTQLAFRLEGSIDGTNWAPIVPVTAINATGGVATTVTTNGGIFRTVALAPYMRFVCTTAPGATAGFTVGGANLCF